MATYLRSPDYRRELQRAFLAARKHNGICADGELFGVDARSRSPFFAEVLAPHGINTQLVAVVHHMGRVTGVIHLNRKGRAFTQDDVDALKPLMRSVGLAHAAVEHTPTPLDGDSAEISRLSPREREVAVLVARGRTNAEISAILGTAVATVRHQVEAILRKLGADNRAAVAAFVQRELLSKAITLPPGVPAETLHAVWGDMRNSIA